MADKVGSARKLLLMLPSLAGGGAERACVTLANALHEDGWRVRLATVHGGGPLEDRLAVGIERCDLGYRRVAAALLALPALVRRWRPDVVLSTPAHLNLAVLLTRFAHPAGTCLFVREANTPSRTLPTQPLPRLFLGLSRYLYARADAVLCPARLVSEELVSLFDLPASRVHVLANPVDWAALAHARAQPLRRPGEGLRFVAAGRLTTQKNFAALLRCMRLAPASARLELFGSGPLQGELTRLAAEPELAGRVTLHGFSHDLWRWFAGADAVILPSLWEGMPNVALEALGCGTRVVAMRSAGGIAELEPRRADALVLVDDEASLVEAMGAMRPVDDAGQRDSLLAAEHRREAVARRFTELYESHRAGAS